MAGDWIPCRINLFSDPRVMAVASKLGIDRHGVVGRLLDIWAWAGEYADENGVTFLSRSCHASVTQVSRDRSEHVTLLSAIDAHVGTTGMGNAMLDVGWIVNDDGCFRFSDWHQWNSKSSRARILSTRRQQIKRHAHVTQVSRSKRDKSVTREEKRREENNTPYIVPLETPRIDASMIYAAYPRKVGKAKAIKAIETALSVLSKRKPGERGGNDSARWLLERVKAFAASPAGQAGEFTPHPTTWFNQGRYDDDEREWQRGGEANRGGGVARLRAPEGKYDRFEPDALAAQRAALDSAQRAADA